MWMEYYDYDDIVYYFREVDRMSEGCKFFSETIPHEFQNSFYILDGHILTMEFISMTDTEYESCAPVVDRSILDMLNDYVMMRELT